MRSENGSRSDEDDDDDNNNGNGNGTIGHLFEILLSKRSVHAYSCL